MVIGTNYHYIGLSPMYELIDPDCRPIVFKNGGFYGVTDVLAHMPEHYVLGNPILCKRRGTS